MEKNKNFHLPCLCKMFLRVVILCSSVQFKADVIILRKLQSKCDITSEGGSAKVFIVALNK